jgi:hypothetical protein
MNADREAIVKTLEGLKVEVVAGPILHDTTEKELTKRGVMDILHALSDDGWKIVRE